MSDAPAPEGKKKGGKLPIIIVLAAVLGGGGFFMMKGKGGDKKHAEAPVIQQAEKETELEEFLTNTSNPSIYVRTKITLRLRKDFEQKKFDASLGDVRDAVLMVLNSTSPNVISDATKRGELKKQLAEAMNTALEGPLKEEEGDGHGDGHKKPEREGKVTEKANPKAEESRRDDWDSETGPVLKVRFTSLATQ